VLVAVGTFLGTAAPRWIGGHLDQTLRETVIRAGQHSEVSARADVPAMQNVAAAEIPRLQETVRPELGRLLDGGHWAVSTNVSDLLAQNGRPVDDGNYPRRLSVRMPDDLASRVRLVEGELPSKADVVPMPSSLNDLPVPDVEHLRIVDTVATPEVAEALRLELGDVVVFEHKGDLSSALNPDATRLPLAGRLTGLVEAVDPDDRMWGYAGTALLPDLGMPGAEPRITTATLLSDPALLEDWAATLTLPTEWHVGVDAREMRAEDVQSVTAALNLLELEGTWHSGLTGVLDGYTTRKIAAEGVVAFGAVALAALCAALILLGVRLLADRQVAEVALARSRGSSDAALMPRLAVVAATVVVPAASLGVLVALTTVPGPTGASLLAVPVVLALIAIAALPVVVVGHARRRVTGSPERADVAARRPSPRRLVAELGVALLAAVTLWLTAARDPDAEPDLVVSSAPIAVAAAVGLLIFRLMPFLLAAVVPGTRRMPGPTAFLSAARASRASSHAVLPLIAILVAIGVAGFGGTVRASVEHARDVSSWNTVGADVRADSTVIRVAPEQVDTLAGVDAVATGHIIPSVRPRNLDNGRRAGLDVFVVDVPAWRDVTAGAPEPVEPIAALSGDTQTGAVPGVLQGNIEGIEVGDHLELELWRETVAIEVVDRVSSVPGGPRGAALVLPLGPLTDLPLASPEVVFVAGDLSGAELALALGIDENEVTTRADTMLSIADDPVLSAVVTAFRIITVLAAALAAAAAVLGLAAGERSRAYGLSILRTLGLTTRQTAAMTVADVVPTTIVAALAGIAVGSGVGAVTAGAIDLRMLSGTVSADTGVVVDVAGVSLAAAGVLAVVLAAIVVTVIMRRRTRLGSVLRAGDER
jgi:putative ABC transport system permease protein